MRFPVQQANQVRLAEVSFVREEDLTILRSWSTLPAAGELLVQDAAEYAALACDKLEAAHERKRLARSLAEAREKIREDPQGELISLLVARALWPRAAAPLGFCLFRRTWAHNLYVDYLGNDPHLFQPGAARIKGIGTGLLFAVMTVGQQLSAGHCLIEATDQSFGFYRKTFRLMQINDIFAVSPAEQWHFLENTRAEWAKSGLTLDFTV